MRRPKIGVFLHLVWATWDREPSIDPEWEKRLYAAIAAKCKEKNCPAYAVNGVADHIHVLLRLPATLSLAEAAQHLKGATSHLINAEFAPRKPFRWQASYGAHAVETQNIDRVRAYILNQKKHHADNKVIPEWEQTQEHPEPEQP